MQTKLGLATLIKNYKFTMNNKTIEPLVLDPHTIVLSSKQLVYLNAEKINN